MSIPIKFDRVELCMNDPVGIFPFGDLVIRLKDAKALDRLIEQCRDIKLKLMEEKQHEMS